MKTFKYILLAIGLTALSGFAQETLDAGDPNTFIFGGDQKTTNFSLDILPLAIIDIEPDPGGAGSGSGLGPLEAGLPVTGVASNLDNLWLNFTHRADGIQPGRIYVSTNQPVTVGMVIYVEIEPGNYGVDGDFPKNPIIGQVISSQTEQIIVNNFLNGYTGDGLNNGYHLIYTIDNPSSNSLPAGFEILYRIE